MNKAATLEWLTVAYHDLKSAQILFSANHFTDSIGSDLQQSIEKILKSIIAFENQKIKKSHDLVEIYALISNKITFDEIEIIYLERATDYFKEDRYPNPYYSLPPREEIEEVLIFTENLFDQVCNMFEIEIERV